MTMRFGSNGGFKGVSVSKPNGALYFGPSGGFVGGRSGDLFQNRNGAVSGFRIRSQNGDAMFLGRNGSVSGYSVGGLYFDCNGRNTGWKL